MSVTLLPPTPPSHYFARLRISFFPKRIFFPSYRYNLSHFYVRLSVHCAR